MHFLISAVIHARPFGSFLAYEQKLLAQHLAVSPDHSSADETTLPLHLPLYL